MLPKSIKHYCQKCLAPNPLGQDLCARCGTRLMLVIEPPTTRYEDGGLVATHEEHLLERISALENRISRLTDKLEQTLNLLLRQARNSYDDHALIETLISVLSRTGAVDAVKLDKLWQDRCERDSADQEKSLRREQLRTLIISAYKGSELQAFEECVKEGVDLLGENEAQRGMRALERAAALAIGNAPLHILIGEHCFEVGKNTLARDYLERALVADARNERVRLLLGLACGDAGDVDRARELLRTFLKHAGESFAARYGLGRLFVAEEKWSEALREFKSALAARPSAEAHYALGCVYYQLERDRLAARHHRKAFELDEDYAAASYMLGLTLLRMGESEKASTALVAASASEEPRYRSAARRILRSGEMPARPAIFGVTGPEKKRLITGGDSRLAQAVREDALGITKADRS